MLCHVYYSSLRDDIYRKMAKIRNLLIEFAHIFQIYYKTVVEYEGNRMRESVVYYCVENCKIKQWIILRTEQSKCLVTHLYLNNILFLFLRS